MTGFHGKAVEIRISTAETVISGVQLVGPISNAIGQTRIFQAPSTQRDWKYDEDRTLIQYTDGVGNPAYLNTQTRLINYAGGAVHFGNDPLVTSGLMFAQAVSMTLSTVGSLRGDSRSFKLNVASDTVDTTTMGQSWGTFATGLAKFDGSLDGLYVDDFWYKQACATLSGLIPTKVIRVRPNPAKGTTYYQGTVIFPSWELSGAFDAAISHTTPFNGRGPLDLIVESTPYFSINP